MLRIQIGDEIFSYDVDIGDNIKSGEFSLIQRKTGKVKTLASVDVEKVNSIKECVEKIITENRLNQGLDHLRMNHLEFVPENIGTFIKWVTSDAIREELDTIIESGLVPKDIGSAASKVARDWFFKNTQFNLEKTEV